MRDELAKLLLENSDKTSTEIVYMYMGGYQSAMANRETYHMAQQIMNELKADLEEV